MMLNYKLLFEEIGKKYGKNIHDLEELTELFDMICVAMSTVVTLKEMHDIAEKEIGELRFDNIKKGKELSIAERCLLEMVKGNKLTAIVKGKNKSILDDNDVIIDHFGPKLIYPKLPDLH